MLGWIPWLAITAAILHTAGGAPVRPETVVPARAVHDAVFAYLIGLIEQDLYGTVDETILDEAVRRSAGDSSLPYRRLEIMSRLREPGLRTAQVEIAFIEDLKVPVPYHILGYAPGDLRSSRKVVFREWDLGSLVLSHQGTGKAVDVRLTDVHLFALRKGSVWVDIDGWIDSLLGGMIDDTRITGLALFRYQGELWGLAVGYNREWKGRSGLLNLRENEIRYPSPPPLKTAAWKMRQILEGLEPTLRPDSLKASDSRRGGGSSKKDGSGAEAPDPSGMTIRLGDLG